MPTRLVHSADPPLLYPGIFVRIGAFTIDFLVLVVLDILTLVVIGIPAAWAGAVAIADLDLVELMLWLLVRWLYFALWEASPYCATPGAMACHLKVIDAVDGERPTFSQTSIRFVGRFISALPLGAGWIPIFIQPQRRTVHDLLSGCVVVRFEPRVVLDSVLDARPDELLRLDASVEVPGAGTGEPRLQKAPVSGSGAGPPAAPPPEPSAAALPPLPGGRSSDSSGRSRRRRRLLQHKRHG